MQKRALLLTILVILSFTIVSSAIVINEFAADPKTFTDEWVELYNPSPEEMNLSGWTLIVNDSSPDIENLSGIISPEGYLTILNPAGSISNEGQILLYNSSRALIDTVTFGSWNDTYPNDNAPDGNADSSEDECLARIPNSVDTNSDINDFVKTFCTYNSENGVLPDNEQGLNATILGKIVLKILPRWLEFGQVNPGTLNNRALNGPIIFNATGSGADFNIKITEVLGYPFEQELKIDSRPALGLNWTILHTSPVKTAEPTLDVPEDAPAGTVQRTIVYTVYGTP